MSAKTTPKGLKEVTYNDAVARSKEYFGGDELAATVWVSKYALKDSFGHIYESSPEDMHHRIAAEIERIEKNYPNPLSRDEIFALLDHFRYVIPQGGPMTGIGNNLQIASLSNCFVIGHKKPADSYGGIIRMDEEQVQIMKRRGGVGHDLSHLRPTGSPVLNSALTSTGIVPFMERYSNSTREVAQDGRRGALMLTISIKHPDAERFIDAKVDTGKVTGANVSVKIDDEFMRAALAGKKYHQQFPIKSDAPKYEQDIDAKKLWEKIIHNAWKSAEPGVLFWDTIIRESIPDCYADEGFTTVSTNPCGEIPLCPYDSCRLLAMNLLSYVENPFKADAKFDFDKFRETGLTPVPAERVAAPLIAEAPVSIECRVRQVLPLGTHDMFLAEVVGVQADEAYIDPATGRFCLERADPIVYSHGEYFALGEALGHFGWSVRKKKKAPKRR